VEGSSHQFGLFYDIVESCDVLLSDGRVVHCSENENSDLFYALPWSYGSLGFLVKIDLRIIPCKPFVRLQYIPCHSLDELVQRFTDESLKETPHFFVEMLMYSRDTAVLMLGDMVDASQVNRKKINSIGRWYKPWFYRHVETFLKKGEDVEYIPLRQYYHRHTKSIFWEAELIIPFGNHPLFRYPLGWMLPPKVSFLKLTQTELVRKYYEEQHIVQDLLCPITKLHDCIEWCHRDIRCYPLWMCAHLLKRTDPQGMLRPDSQSEGDEMYVDVGIWGVPHTKNFNGKKGVMAMEKWCRENRSYQTLYADTYMTREEFWSMFNPELYEKCRQKYGAIGVMMDVYDKVKKQQ